MCEPLSMIALAGSAISAGVSYMGQQETMDAQQKANDDWVAYQRSAAARASALDDANRQKAQAALATSEGKLTPEAQGEVQQKSQADLTDQMLKGSPAAPDSNIAILGGGDPANTEITNDIGSRITNAARAASGRIKALAGLSSYGNGYGAMGAAANTALTDSGQDIALASDFRKGDTSTLAAAQAVQPLQYTAGSNIAGTIADKLGSIAGSAFSASPTGQGLAKSIKGGFA